jgi:exodeoxyribonuclease VII large subunit
MLFDDTSAARPANPEILSVSQLNQAVSRLLERNFPLSWIAGEISNFTRAASGHWYFTLKDQNAQVRAVMFRGRAQYADFNPREGDKVEVRAIVTLYAARGDFQLNVEAIRRAGVGNLYEAFLKLKQKLADAGMFDPARKRTLPVFPRTIGIVTSPQAAALRDILTTLKRRAPHVAVVLYPTAVQGDGSAAKIAAAIASASRRAECDVLLVCRGGGSMEDLWSFNDESVAQAIADCSMPVITGIGHETDFTIADFVADLRAPTPTAAAEMAATARADWLSLLLGHAEDLSDALRRQLNEKTQTLDWTARRLQSPAAAIGHQKLRLAAAHNRLLHATITPLTAARHRLEQLERRLQNRMPETRLQRANLVGQSRRLAAAFHLKDGSCRQQLAALQAQLDLLAPQRTLERGYAILRDEAGNILRQPTAIAPPQTLTLTLAGGSAHIEVAGVTLQKDKPAN